MQIVPVIDNGDFYIHKAGCRDIERFVKSHRNSEALPAYEATSEQQVLVEEWDCIWQEYTPDDADLNDPEVQRQAISDSGCDAGTRFLPCTKGLKVFS